MVQKMRIKKVEITGRLPGNDGNKYFIHTEKDNNTLELIKEKRPKLIKEKNKKCKVCKNKKFFIEASKSYCTNCYYPDQE